MGELTRTQAFGRGEILPTFTCGHCTNVVVMRAERSRPRTRCMKCGKFLCEKSELCMKDCTPMHEMARDHFEGVQTQKWGRFVKAIMNGVTTEEEGLRKGLILP